LAASPWSWALQEALRHRRRGTPAWGPTTLATLVSCIVGYGVIVSFLRYLAWGTFTPFVVYRIVLALLLVCLIGIDALDPVSTAVL
jgi:undecaprenyl-diphosphatase